MKLMKLWLIIVTVVLCAFIMSAMDANAQTLNLDFDFTVKGGWNFYQDDSLEQGMGAEARLTYKDFFYLFGSYAQTKMRLYGQNAGDINLYGVGLGMKIKLVDGLYLFGQAGYFLPSMKMEGKDEIFHYKKMGWLNETNFTQEQKNYFMANYQKYIYELKGNFGGALGLDLEREILFKNFFLGISGAYQFLKLPETFKAEPEVMRGQADYLEWKGHRNFSSAHIGVNLTYKF